MTKKKKKDEIEASLLLDILNIFQIILDGSLSSCSLFFLSANLFIILIIYICYECKIKSKFHYGFINGRKSIDYIHYEFMQ